MRRRIRRAACKERNKQHRAVRLGAEKSKNIDPTLLPLLKTAEKFMLQSKRAKIVGNLDSVKRHMLNATGVRLGDLR